MEPEAVTKVYITFNPILNIQANHFILILYKGATVND